MKLRVHFGDYASEDKVKFDDLPPSTDVKNVNINSGENLKTMFSKIKAVIGGLKTVAFTNSYNDLVDKLKIATNLTTDDDSQVLSAKQGKILNDELTSTKKSVSDGKKDVAAAITAKGVSVTSTDANPATFATLVSKINAITATISINGNKAVATIGNTTVTKDSIGTSISGTKTPGTTETTLAEAGTLLHCSGALKVGSVGGNASAGDVLTGKTFSSNTAGRLASGTMANNGAVTASVNCGGTYTIPAGYHNGSGKVTGNSLSSQITVASFHNKYSKTFKALASCPAVCTSANCIYDGVETIFLTGGELSNQMYAYNIRTNTWTLKKSLDASSSCNSAARAGMQIKILGNNGYVYSYDMQTNKCTKGSSAIPPAGSGGACSMLYDFAVFGSSNSSYKKYVYSYNSSGWTLFKTAYGLSCSNDNYVHVDSSGVYTISGTEIVAAMSPLADTQYANRVTDFVKTSFGGFAVLPGSHYLLSSVEYSNKMTLINNNGVQTVFWPDYNFGNTKALCVVGDDVYYFGAAHSGHEKRACVLHLELFTGETLNLY